MCGKEFRGGIPLKKLIGKTYTDMDIHKAPEETHICEACAFCLMTSKIGLARLSRYSFVANNEELHISATMKKHRLKLRRKNSNIT